MGNANQKTQQLAEPLDTEVVARQGPQARHVPWAHCAFFLLCLLSPLYLGGNRPIASSIIEITALWIGVSLICSQQKGENRGGASKHLVYLGLSFLGIAFLQLLPLNKTLLYLISPALEQFQGINRWPSISIAPYQTMRSLITFTCYFVCLLGLVKKTPRISSKDFRTRLLWVASMVGFVVAGISLAHWSLELDSLYGVYPLKYRIIDHTKAHWPFVNTNHLAGFLLATSLASSTLLLSSLKNLRGLLMSLSSVLICALVILLTQSKSAIFLFAILQTALFAVLALELRKHTSNPWVKSAIVPLCGLAVFSVLLLLYFLIDQKIYGDLLKRAELFHYFGLDNIRRALYTLSVEILKDYPLFGIGLGNWQNLAPSYAGSELAFYYLDFAHSDPLELVVEIGLIGSALLLFATWPMFVGLVNAHKKTQGIDRVVLYGCLLSCLAIPLQSIFEFSLQIPGVLVVELALIAATLSFFDSCIEDKLSCI